jgi:hypothetical protein
MWSSSTSSLYESDSSEIQYITNTDNDIKNSYSSDICSCYVKDVDDTVELSDENDDDKNDTQDNDAIYREYMNVIHPVIGSMNNATSNDSQANSYTSFENICHAINTTVEDHKQTDYRLFSDYHTSYFMGIQTASRFVCHGESSIIYLC